MLSSHYPHQAGGTVIVHRIRNQGPGVVMYSIMVEVMQSGMSSANLNSS